MGGELDHSITLFTVGSPVCCSCSVVRVVRRHQRWLWDMIEFGQFVSYFSVGPPLCVADVRSFMLCKDPPFIRTKHNPRKCSG